MLDLIGRPDLLMITMLRNPVERVMSDYAQRQRAVRQRPERFTAAYLQLIGMIVDLPLQDCLDHDLLIRDLRNSQTRMLGGRNDYAVFLKHGSQAQMAGPLLRPFKVPHLIDPDDLDLQLTNAKRWLAEVAVVGLTERYAETVMLIADRLGIPAPADLPYANYNPQRSSAAMRYSDKLGPHVVARLEELNRQDIELYAYASELFAQQWARYQARPRRTYSIAAHALQIARRYRAYVKQSVLAIR